MVTYIYALVDPRTDEIRYVGKSDDPQRRLVCHLRDCERTNTHAANWLKQLKRNDLIPTIKILEKVSQSDWVKAERRWIKRLRKQFNLTNSTDGGDGVFNPCAETRAKLSRVNKGRKRSPEAIEKMKLSHVGIKPSKEAIEKRAQSLRGQKRPKWVGKKISKAKKGVPGRKWSNKEKAHLSRVNAKLTPDNVRKIRNMLVKGIERKVIANKFGVNYTTIMSIDRGISHRFVK